MPIISQTQSFLSLYVRGVRVCARARVIFVSSVSARARVRAYVCSITRMRHPRGYSHRPHPIDYGKQSPHIHTLAPLWFPPNPPPNIPGIWCNLSPGPNQICIARGRPALFISLISRRVRVKFPRSRLKAPPLPRGSIRRIIVLLQTTQLFNYASVSPPFLHCNTELTENCISMKSVTRHHPPPQKKKMKSSPYRSYTLRVLNLRKAFQKSLGLNQVLCIWCVQTQRYKTTFIQLAFF